MPLVQLSDRGLVKVSGPDAKTLLNALITCDLDRVSPTVSRFGALLTPQGKILFDFIVFEASEDHAGGYYFDMSKAQIPDFVRRLGFYKLRAKVSIEDVSDAFAVIAGWNSSPTSKQLLATPDPRLADLGWRAIIPVGELLPSLSTLEAYQLHRITLGIPEGGRDFAFGDAFPHEALMDQMQGIDFDKGCYIGQEVVSRMQHRGTARTRLVCALYEGVTAVAPGLDVTAGEIVLGKTGSGAGNKGLVMIRLDRAADALAAGRIIHAGGVPIRLTGPSWVNFPLPGEKATAG